MTPPNYNIALIILRMTASRPQQSVKEDATMAKSQNFFPFLDDRENRRQSAMDPWKCKRVEIIRMRTVDLSLNQTLHHLVQEGPSEDRGILRKNHLK